MPLDNKPELLAPAGTIEVFEIAVEKGADAVYVGAPDFNARALAKNFTMAEIGAMVDHAHKSGVKVYIAMNSLLKEAEVPHVLETLAVLEYLQVDALIIQDLGIYHLARKYFPGLRLHASTLLAAHNSLAVKQFSQMGFERVVLARELTLKEIGEIHRKVAVELEVFVHGAMCFSYSGLCLFSSFLGGKSGLRGRCVQPCRRRYTWEGSAKGLKSGYFFSMNDMSAFETVSHLTEIGVKSLKIEGRMRSVQYVGNVVQAYRLMLDADPSDRQVQKEVLALLREDMSRRSFGGYFAGPQPVDALSPKYSGNTGIFVGKVDEHRGMEASLTLKGELKKGDRLRLHREKSGERHAFTLKSIKVKGNSVEHAGIKERVVLELPVSPDPGDSLFKVDVSERRTGDSRAGKIDPAPFAREISKLPIRHHVDKILGHLSYGKKVKEKEEASPQPEKRSPGKGQGKGPRKGKRLEWWLKVDELQIFKQALPREVSRVIVVLSRETLERIPKRKMPPVMLDKIIWALPPIIAEEECAFYQSTINKLIDRGFSEWQVAHLGQLQFFSRHSISRRAPGDGKKGKLISGKRPPGISLYGDYTLNALNSFAFLTLEKFGLRKGQISIETDRKNMEAMIAGSGAVVPGMTVYGWPPLFTARLIDRGMLYNRPFVSPKDETFILRKKWGLTLALPGRQFSLLPWIDELITMGVRYGILDFSTQNIRSGDIAAVFREINKPNKDRRASSFNYNGTLY